MAVTIVAARTADAGAPQVGITVAGMSTSTACTVVVEVTWDGGDTWNAVRCGTVIGALGSVFVRDYLPPLNTPATYRATVTGGSTATVTAGITVSSDCAWLQDPLAPRNAIPLWGTTSGGKVLLALGSLRTLKRAQQVDTVTPLGASLPVASIGVRQAPSGIPLRLVTDIAQEGGALLKMLNAAGQLALRGLPFTGLLPPVAHVAVGDVSEERRGRRGNVTVYTLQARQVRPISMRVIVPWWTYDQVKALVQSQVGTGATYAAVIAAMPAGKTYTAWLANPGVV